MSDPKADKKAQSIDALKNANKHLADIFTDLGNKDTTLRTVASDIQNVARQVGDVMIVTWDGDHQKTIFLKTFLNSCATKLEQAR